MTKHIKAYLNSKSIFIYNKNFFTFFFFFSSTLIVHINTMSLEIWSIGEVISYQTTPRTEFVVGMGIVKSKTNEDENITFNITQFVPIDAEAPCYVVPLAPKDIIYFHGTVTNIDSPTKTMNVTCSHSRKISLNPSSIPHDLLTLQQLVRFLGNQILQKWPFLSMWVFLNMLKPIQGVRINPSR